MTSCKVRPTVLNLVQRRKRCVKPKMPGSVTVAGNVQVGTHEQDPSVMYQPAIPIPDHPLAVVEVSLVLDRATKSHPAGKNRNSSHENKHY